MCLLCCAALFARPPPPLPQIPILIPTATPKIKLSKQLTIQRRALDSACIIQPPIIVLLPCEIVARLTPAGLPQLNREHQLPRNMDGCAPYMNSLVKPISNILSTYGAVSVAATETVPKGSQRR